MYHSPLTALVTLAAVTVTALFMSRVGSLRGKQQLNAPRMDGDEAFQRANRVHCNTIEQLVMFLPVLWLAVPVLGDPWAAAVGAVWVLGRLLYSRAYQQDPPKRLVGMLLTAFPTLVLMLAVLWGLFRSFTA